MNILFLFYAPMLPFVGGIQRATENLAKELTSRGHKVCYLSISNEDREVKYDYPVPQYFIDFNNKESCFESYLKLIEQKNIDVVVNQEPRVDLLEVLSHTPSGVKRITCFHTQPFLTQGKTRRILKYYKPRGIKAFLYRSFCWVFPKYHSRQTLLLERKMLKETLAVSELLCLESEYYIPRVVRFMPDIDRKKLVAVNNPNSFPLIAIDKQKKENIILWIGRQINTPKNVPAFIDFWKTFYQRHPDWRAIVVGVGPDLESNKHYAYRKKVENLEFLGHVDNVAVYYERASFFMMTSMYEGFPMVLLEAMNNACIPCVYDTFESLHDIVDDGVNGVIVPAYDYNRMISRIEDIMQDKTVMYSMQNSAIEKTKKFSVERIVNKWETILSGLGHESE